ncbi:alpha/beta fold hydrolase [Streptomyces sp. NPDC059466]|uniref:alpha/beta fold hydrolase n=1 Tax=unclassified Streptomyces TaxID=2593676 RepID=UPI0036B84377
MRLTGPGTLVRHQPEEACTLAAVVLGHGLYHRPEHFALVAERLWTAGTEVVVPELHRGSSPAGTAAVRAVIDSPPEPPTVLGHSFGGSVITGPRRAGHLVLRRPSCRMSARTRLVRMARPRSSRTRSPLCPTARPAPPCARTSSSATVPPAARTRDVDGRAAPASPREPGTPSARQGDEPRLVGGDDELDPVPGAQFGEQA